MIWKYFISALSPCINIWCIKTWWSMYLTRFVHFYSIYMISRLNEASWAGWRRTCLRINRWVLVTPLILLSSYYPSSPTLLLLLLLLPFFSSYPPPLTLLLNSQPDHNIINKHQHRICETDNKPGETYEPIQNSKTIETSITSKQIENGEIVRSIDISRLPC